MKNMSNNEEYLQGKENWFIRMYFYLKSGNSLVNDFRNLGLGIFLAYLALKMDNPWILLIMLIVAVPILIVLGYYLTHRISKVMEWLSTKYSTHYGIKSFELMEKQVKLLEEINRKLDREYVDKLDKK